MSLLIILSFLIRGSLAFGLQTVDQDNILFAADHGKDGQLLYSTLFLGPNQTSSQPQVFAVDFLNQANPTPDVKKLLILKTEFLLKRSPLELKNLHLESMSTLATAFGFKMDPQCPNSCDVAQTIHYFIFSFGINFNIESQVYDLTQADDTYKNTLAGLGVQTAPWELRLYARHWSEIFAASQSSSYFVPFSESETAVVTYQILTITSAAYSSFPFLESTLKSVLLDQTNGLVEYLQKQ